MEAGALKGAVVEADLAVHLVTKVSFFFSLIKYAYLSVRGGRMPGAGQQIKYTREEIEVRLRINGTS